MELSNVLVDQVNHPSGTLAFDAAICIGHLCIYNEDAKYILLNSLEESTYAKIADVGVIFIPFTNLILLILYEQCFLIR